MKMMIYYMIYYLSASCKQRLASRQNERNEAAYPKPINLPSVWFREPVWEDRSSLSPSFNRFLIRLSTAAGLFLRLSAKMRYCQPQINQDQLSNIQAALCPENAFWLLSEPAQGWRSSQITLMSIIWNYIHCHNNICLLDKILWSMDISVSLL